MNKTEFYEEFKRLCEYFGQLKLLKDKEIMQLYYNATKSLNKNDFRRKCNNFIATFSYMPKIADFITIKIPTCNYEQRNYTEQEFDKYYDN